MNRRLMSDSFAERRLLMGLTKTGPSISRVVGRPWVVLRIEERNAAAARNSHERIGLGRLTVEFRRLQMHACETTDYLEMAKHLRADVHQKVFAFRILAIQT